MVDIRSVIKCAIIKAVKNLDDATAKKLQHKLSDYAGTYMHHGHTLIEYRRFLRIFSNHTLLKTSD